MDKLYKKDTEKNEYDFDILILYKSGDEKELLNKVHSFIREERK